MGNPQAVQQLELRASFHCRGHRFNPCSGNQDSACHAFRQRKKKKINLQRANSLEKTLMLGKTEGKRRKGQKRMRWLDGITDSVDMNFGKLGDGEGQSQTR